MASEAPSTTRAVYYEDYGDASDVLKVGEQPLRAVGAKDVLIEVKAAGVNPVDFKLRKGYIKAWPCEMPTVIGWDAAGVVKAVGAEASRIKVGDEVYAYTRPAFDLKEEHPESADEKIDNSTGGTADLIVVPEWKVAVKPPSVSMAVAGSVPLAGLTAWQALFDHGKLTEGQTVLILNASGGVGGFAVQFAKAKGATVVGTCSAGKAEYVTSLGTDHVVDYNAEGGIATNVGKLGLTIDLVFDAIGGDSTAQGLKALKDGGACITIANGGALAGLIEAEGRGQLGGGFLVKPDAAQLDEITALFEAGTVKAPALTEMSFDEAAKAHEASESGKVHGKIVLLP